MTDSTVLVVDDDPQVRELYKQYILDEYEVRTAFDGQSALETIDESVDVVLLDRRMPGLSGDEFLQTVRDRGYVCPVVMVTAVEPDVDILELGFDEYLVKPVSRDELLEVVGSMNRRVSYERNVQDWLALLSKKATLESVKTEEELDDSPEYWALLEEIEQFNDRADAELEDLAADELDALFGRVKMRAPDNE